MEQFTIDPDTMYCFLDTSTLIHYQTFNEVIWHQILGAKKVCLILAPIILSELSKHKDDYSHEWLQERSRTLIPMIENALPDPVSFEPAELRNGVDIFDIRSSPVVKWDQEGLDPTVNDDRLLAAIMKFYEQYPMVKL